MFYFLDAERLQLGREEVAAPRAALAAAEARAAIAEAKVVDDAALIAQLKLQITKLQRAEYGQRSERGQRLLDQYELQLEELEASATVDELRAEMAAARTSMVETFVRRRPSRQPFPEHLPRERVIVPAPTACTCCGGARLSKLGEDVTETLEVVPCQLKVIQTVRERFSCRECERISQPPRLSTSPLAAGPPNLMAMVLFEKFGAHQPLNRQAQRYAREGVPISLSTLADQVGAGCHMLEPILQRLEAHVLAAERLHGDDATVPVLAKGRTETGRCWTYVRDDRPFGGPERPSAMFYFSRDRKGEHPQAHLAAWSGILPADAYGRYNPLYERAVNGLSAGERLIARRQHSALIVTDVERYMREERAKLPRGIGVAVPLDYMLKRWPAFARFLDDGRICLTNNAAERALGRLALGRKAWLFAGSEHAAAAPRPCTASSSPPS